ncbi:hypothetical protein Dimus_030967 [Dionaea muscipula]
MGPRWKGKGSEGKALEEPMSKTVSELKSLMGNSDSNGFLSETGVLLEADAELAELLNRACFGCPNVTAGKDKQWFQLGLEEAFYMCHSLKCLKIQGDYLCTKSEAELWEYWSSRVKKFPELYKAYSHLRMKNWVVRAGSQYGVDYVAYRHHPALVHSEYAVLVLSNNDERLREWTDFHCTLRLCGGVAKTLLVLHIEKNGSDTGFPMCLESYTVEEHTITRWIPELSREV